MLPPAPRCPGNGPVRRRTRRTASGCSSSNDRRSARSRCEPRPASITAMDHVVVSTPDPERAAALYGARLGLDMALDRSHPEWGRLMFFRCGDLIVEVSHRPGKPADGTHDRLRGMCWRVADIDATHARLAGRRRRRLRGPHRPQAGHAGDDRAQRHLRRSDAAGAAVGAQRLRARLHSLTAPRVLHRVIPSIIERLIWPRQSEF